jgi:preprotein translocase subunit YajC
VNYLPFVIFILIIFGLFAFSARARRRQAAALAQRAERIGVGSEVMTTSGLYGTVVAKNDDESVQMSIAPGVEVRWELAALRDTASLPDRFKRDAGIDENRSSTIDLEKGDSPHGADPTA